MSTILIDRRTAALLGELAATAPAGATRGVAVDGVALGVGVRERPGAAGRSSERRPARPAAPVTRPTRPRNEEISTGHAEITVRRPATAEARLRRRLRCGPTGASTGRSGAAHGARRAVAGRSRPRGGLHLTRRGRLAALLLFLVVLTVAFSVGRVTSTALGDPSAPSAEVVVQRGDTLWSIAERTAPDRDPRATSTDLMAVNGLGSPSLEVGQHLRLP